MLDKFAKPSVARFGTGATFVNLASIFSGLLPSAGPVVPESAPAVANPFAPPQAFPLPGQMPAPPIAPALAPSSPSKHWTGLSDDTRYTLASIAAALSRSMGSPVGDAAQIMVDRLGARKDAAAQAEADQKRRMELAAALGDPKAATLPAGMLEQVLAKRMFPAEDPMVSAMRKVGFSEEQIKRALGVKAGLFPRAVNQAAPAAPKLPSTKDQYIIAQLLQAQNPASPGGTTITPEERDAITALRSIFVPPDTSAYVGELRADNNARAAVEAEIQRRLNNVDLFAPPGVAPPTRDQIIEEMRTDPIWGPVISRLMAAAKNQMDLELPPGFVPGWGDEEYSELPPGFVPGWKDETDPELPPGFIPGWN